LQGSLCLLRAYPDRQLQEETPFSVRQTSNCSSLHVESSPTIQVSILTRGTVGRRVRGRRIILGGDLFPPLETEMIPLSLTPALGPGLMESEVDTGRIGALEFEPNSVFPGGCGNKGTGAPTLPTPILLFGLGLIVSCLLLLLLLLLAPSMTGRIVPRMGWEGLDTVPGSAVLGCRLKYVRFPSIDTNCWSPFGAVITSSLRLTKVQK